MQLSPHFKLSEFTVSVKARELGIDNAPTKGHLSNLILAALKAEEVRSYLGGAPVIITSGYRSAELNAATSGASSTSDHANGLAFDFFAPRFGTPLEICRVLVASPMNFDQIIFEQSAGGGWVHVGIGPRMRRQVLSKAPGKDYVAGLVVR